MKMSAELYDRYFRNACPLCGGKKYFRSKTCFNCRRKVNPGSIKRNSSHTKEPCPQCGRPKLLASELCASCRWRGNYQTSEGRTRRKAQTQRIDLSSASEPFLYQLAGLFFGEGCIHARISPSNTLSFRLAIKLRADDAEALRHIQLTIGGSFRINPRRGAHSPEAIWEVTRLDDVEQVLLAIKAHTVIPVRKSPQIDIALEYMCWRRSVEFHYVDREKIEWFYRTVHTLKQLPVDF